MSQAREIRNKIGSVKNTQKITRAMELVATSKMRKTQDKMKLSKPYSQKIRQVISHVAAGHAEYRHPYLEPRSEIRRVGFIIVSTDRGLCGGLNINLFRLVTREMKEWRDKNVGVDLCLIGKKAESFFGRLGAAPVGAVNHLGDAPEIQDLIGVVRLLLNQYDQHKLDAIYIATNDFVNTMTQKPVVRQLLPLQPDPKEAAIGRWDYLYEPDSAKELLTQLLIRYIESQVYQAVIENIACEQSSRMVAMKNATENAGEFIKELNLIYNKARQASITREIAEIVGGAAAIE